ncbi:hypothetical protein SUDANB180_02580 [Streptomyces sp. enrichment culture]
MRKRSERRQGYAEPRTVEALVALPIDAWLYEAKPKPGCGNCAAQKARLARAMKAGDASARFEAARNIRQCGHRGGGLRLRGWSGPVMRMVKRTSRRCSPARVALGLAVCALSGWALTVTTTGVR